MLMIKAVFQLVLIKCNHITDFIKVTFVLDYLETTFSYVTLIRGEWTKALTTLPPGGELKNYPKL